jgi:lipopolysaccharide transport system ATP-binding protein
MRDRNSVEIRGLGKTFRISKRKAVGKVDTNTLAAFLTTAANAFRADRPVESGVREIRALHQVDLEVRRGQVLGIIGRNGSGKSTLLKILARVIDPTAGRVEIAGRVASLLELGLGFAPDMTVRENVYLYGQLAGMSQTKMRLVEESILDLADLAAHRDTLLGQCPGGSFIKLAFATMMGIESDVILADEVLAVGDAAFRKVCERRILDATQTGETVFFVSHDMEAIKRLCTEVVWLDQGMVKMIGPADAVVQSYTTDLMRGRAIPAVQGALVDAASPVDLRLVSVSGTPIGALQMDSDARLEALFRVEAGARCAVSFDLFFGKLHLLRVASPFTPRAGTAQTFSAKVDLPRDFFNEATYEARAQLLVTRDGSEIVKARDAFQTLGFAVMNTNSQTSVWTDWQWSRPGGISPRLAWSMEKL